LWEEGVFHGKSFFLGVWNVPLLGYISPGGLKHIWGLYPRVFGTLFLGEQGPNMETFFWGYIGGVTPGVMGANIGGTCCMGNNKAPHILEASAKRI